MRGTRLGNKYEIVDTIGVGTVGTVYRAVDIESGRPVAVRVIHCSDAGEATLKRILRSIETTRILSHPNILAPIDSGFIDDTTPYLVTEFIEGQLLSDALRAEKHLSVERAVSIAAQICDALEHAHYYGVIHRNLKPANIKLLGSSGQEVAKVLDFDLAKSFFQNTKAGQLKVTVNGEVIGTPEFMSPEQCKFVEIDWRSDIYSMGCLLFMMLTGKPPIKGDNALQTMMKQGVQEPMSFERACPDKEIPGAIQEVVFRALCKEREERQQTMTQLRDELIEASGIAPWAPPPDPQMMSSNRKTTASRKKPGAERD